ncbi:unnamed protein product [Brassicogethes aeneus]|uniref:Trehalose 6-phosphate phosphatase n=1 Tax=Brassicogethes aeneus TaxID=1431903 RepID=A0A9P0FAL5_BRAAE|nr:unnamed protein product [Brassicogethes aeneus]
MPHIKCNQIEKVLDEYISNGKKLALLLDYDGTLTPLVAHPDLAVIPNETKEILNRISKYDGLFLAVISGRGLSKVKELVGINGIHYAGNHGFEILSPDGSLYIHQIHEELQKKLREMVDELSKNASDNGAWVEDKTYSITYHYRAVPDQMKKEYQEKALKIMNKSGFRINQAHMAIEAKPPINWNKGTASVMILEKHFSKNWMNETKVIFIGDDTTDEDAMEALKGNSCTFRISQDENVSTHSTHVLKSLDCVLDILKWIDKYYSK